MNPEMVYFHPVYFHPTLAKSNVWEGKLFVESDTRNHLNNSQKRIIFDEFGFSC